MKAYQIRIRYVSDTPVAVTKSCVSDTSLIGTEE